MLELYHSVNSVCAQKVRIALAEKGLEYREHLMTLRGDQFDPAYMKLNPSAVVPTLVHDGRPVIESSVILYYIDEAFPNPPSLMPADPHQRRGSDCIENAVINPAAEFAAWELRPSGPAGIHDPLPRLPRSMWPCAAPPAR